MDRRDLDLDFYELNYDGKYPEIGQRFYSPAYETWYIWNGDRWQPLTKI